MTSKPKSSVAFPDPKTPPTDAALPAALGRSYPRLRRILAWFASACPEATTAWKFSAGSGWYRLALRRQRRIFYLLPQQRSFGLIVILGGKAIAALQAGPDAGRIKPQLAAGQRYPEGTLFRIGARDCPPDLVTALLAAKLRH